MKKSQISVILFSIMVAALAGVTGCNTGSSSDNTESGNGVSTPAITENSTDNSDSTNSHDSSESTLESIDSTPEQLEMISKLKIQSFVGPDGETVQAAGATDVFDTETPHAEIGSPGFKFDSMAVSDETGFDADGNMIDPEMVSTVLRYDFAYIRYCRPLFYAGDLLDDNSIQEKLAELPEIKWFKVRAGDKLDCGLTVKKAVYERFPVETYASTRDNYIEFDGEITLEGVLFTAKSERDYLTKPGDLIFTPDPTKTSGLPASSAQFEETDSVRYCMGTGDIQYVMSDIGCNGWLIGKADEINKDEIFGDDDLVPVKVTLTNIRYGGILSYDMPAVYAEIVEIERAD